jgi:hypothetical protein
VVAFLDHRVVVRDCFGFLIGFQDRFRQIVADGVPTGISGVVFEDFLEANY